MGRQAEQLEPVLSLARPGVERTNGEHSVNRSRAGTLVDVAVLMAASEERLACFGLIYAPDCRDIEVDDALAIAKQTNI